MNLLGRTYIRERYDIHFSRLQSMFRIKQFVDPVDMILHSRESYWETHFTGRTPSHGVDTDKSSSRISSDTRSSYVQGTAHVATLAQTDAVFRDTAIEGIAVGVGYDRGADEVTVKIIQAD